MKRYKHSPGYTDEKVQALTWLILPVKHLALRSRTSLEIEMSKEAQLKEGKEVL